MGRPVVCMITDRSRLPSGAAEDSQASRLEALVRRVGVASHGGCHLVQVRERDLDGAALFTLARDCLQAARLTSARIIVNERLDVALAAGAHGVHLRGDSMPASRVRPLAPRGFLIGRSVHSVDEAIAAHDDGGLDYLLFGPVFATRSKPGAAAAGAQELSRVVQAVRLPVLAVGGVTAETARAVAHAGAAGFAAIGLFSDGTDDRVAPAINAARAAFDTCHPLS